MQSMQKKMQMQMQMQMQDKMQEEMQGGIRLVRDPAEMQSVIGAGAQNKTRPGYKDPGPCFPVAPDM